MGFYRWHGNDHSCIEAITTDASAASAAAAAAANAVEMNPK